MILPRWFVLVCICFFFFFGFGILLAYDPPICLGIFLLFMAYLLAFDLREG